MLGSAADGFVRPRSGKEEEIAGLRVRVIGGQRPGSRDNIFDLGGNSLQLAEIHVQLQERLGEQVQLVHLFENPTIESVARLVDGLASASASTASAIAAKRTQDRAERQKQAMQRRRPPRSRRTCWRAGAA